jgi:hypothetical protein
MSVRPHEHAVHLLHNKLFKHPVARPHDGILADEPVGHLCHLRYGGTRRVLGPAPRRRDVERPSGAVADPGEVDGLACTLVVVGGVGVQGAEEHGGAEYEGEASVRIMRGMLFCRRGRTKKVGA